MNNIILFDRSHVLCTAFNDVFRDVPNIQVFNCDVRDLPKVDYIITPGNSFGIMTGGMDLAIRTCLGYAFQDVVQDCILKNYPYGIPIGDYIIVEGQSEDECPFKNVIYIPTMRIPQPVRIWDISFVMSIIMDIMLKRSESSFAIPGLGTGAGMLQPDIAAASMRAGYDIGMKMRGHGYV